MMSIFSTKIAVKVLAALTFISFIAALLCWFDAYTDEYKPQQPVSYPVIVSQPVLIPEPPVEHVDDEPKEEYKIAIVIDDMGGSFKNTQLAINTLPPEITFSFLPLGTSANQQAIEAQTLGHDILLHIPMEPLGNTSAGKNALLTNLNNEEIANRLTNMLQRFTADYKGANNHMGSKFTIYEQGMNLVLDILKEKNLYFFDSRTNKESIAFDMAKQKGIPTAKRDVFLDNDDHPVEVQKQLELLEDISKANGYAIAIGHPHVSTIHALADWLPKAEKKGFKIVPLNTLILEINQQTDSQESDLE